jgi:hypothetical protein
LEVNIQNHAIEGSRNQQVIQRIPKLLLSLFTVGSNRDSKT